MAGEYSLYMALYGVGLIFWNIVSVKIFPVQVDAVRDKGSSLMVKTILGQTFIFILGFVAIMTLFGFINKYIFLPYLSDYDLTLTGVLIIYASVFFFIVASTQEMYLMAVKQEKVIFYGAVFFTIILGILISFSSIFFGSVIFLLLAFCLSRLFVCVYYQFNVYRSHAPYPTQKY